MAKKTIFASLKNGNGGTEVRTEKKNFWTIRGKVAAKKRDGVYKVKNSRTNKSVALATERHLMKEQKPGAGKGRGEQQGVAGGGSRRNLSVNKHHRLVGTRHSLTVNIRGKWTPRAGIKPKKSTRLAEETITHTEGQPPKEGKITNVEGKSVSWRNNRVRNNFRVSWKSRQEWAK